MEIIAGFSIFFCIATDLKTKIEIIDKNCLDPVNLKATVKYDVAITDVISVCSVLMETPSLFMVRWQTRFVSTIKWSKTFCAPYDGKAPF